MIRKNSEAETLTGILEWELEVAPWTAELDAATGRTETILEDCNPICRTELNFAKSLHVAAMDTPILARCDDLVHGALIEKCAQESRVERVAAIWSSTRASRNLASGSHAQRSGAAAGDYVGRFHEK